MKLVKDLEKTSINQSGVTDKEAEEAFRKILRWIGKSGKVIAPDSLTSSKSRQNAPEDAEKRHTPQKRNKKNSNKKIRP